MYNHYRLQNMSQKGFLYYQKNIKKWYSAF